MKSVLISIQPKWRELIASGKKTIEVRKTAPKLEAPFKCYIYESKGRQRLEGVKKTKLGESCLYPFKPYFYTEFKKGAYEGRGKIIGEFVCDRIDKYTCEFWNDTPDYMDKGHAMEQIRKSYYADPDDWECEEEFEYITGNEVENPDDCDLCKQACLAYAEIRNYVGIGDKTFYGWHISDLKIYDKPKELGEFRHWVGCENSNKLCCMCKYSRRDCNGILDCQNRVERPPQSWCYVEEV